MKVRGCWKCGGELEFVCQTAADFPMAKCLKCGEVVTVSDEQEAEALMAKDEKKNKVKICRLGCGEEFKGTYASQARWQHEKKKCVHKGKAAVVKGENERDNKDVDIATEHKRLKETAEQLEQRAKALRTEAADCDKKATKMKRAAKALA